MMKTERERSYRLKPSDPATRLKSHLRVMNWLVARDSILAALRTLRPQGIVGRPTALRRRLKRLAVALRNRRRTGNSMKLYDLKAGANTRRVRIFLAEKGVTFPTVEVDRMKVRT